MSRLYTLHRNDLRKLAENPPPRMRWDDDFSPDWRHGFLALLAFIVMLGWLDAMDNAEFYKKAADDANRKAQEARQELQDGPHIRWLGNGYKCTFGAIQREWHQVMATECARVGNMLTAARASE